MFIITYILIGLNTLIFALSQFLSIGGRSIQELYLKNDLAISQGEYYRLLTSTFLHGDVFHIFANMYSLYNLRFLESTFGSLGFILLYIASGIGGSLMSYFVQSGNSLGASGSVSGLIGSALTMAFLSKDTSMLQQIFYIIIINVVIGIMPGSRIDNFAHLGGLIVGIIITLLLVKLKF